MRIFNQDPPVIRDRRVLPFFLLCSEFTDTGNYRISKARFCSIFIRGMTFSENIILIKLYCFLKYSKLHKILNLTEAVII